MNPTLKLKDKLLSEILDEIDQRESLKLKPEAQPAVTSKSEEGDIHEKGAEINANSVHEPKSNEKGLGVARDEDDEDPEDLKKLLQSYLADT